MSLNNLQPAKGSNKTSVKDLVEVKVLEKVVPQQKVIKVLNQDLDILEKLVLKVDRCHFKEGFQSLVSTTLIELNIKPLM